MNGEEPLFFVSSALIPFEHLHGGFRIAAMIKPFTHVVNSLRMLAQGTTIDWYQLLSTGGLLLVLGATSFIVAVLSLKKDRH